jgi:hypothetical protein
VERIALSDWDTLRAELERRYADESDEAAVAVVTTSGPITILVAEVAEAADKHPPMIYWIEQLDPHLVSDEPLFCQITHSGQVIEHESDLFWGLSAEVSATAAGQLGVNLEVSAHSEVSEQAAAIRECVANGASVVATTLVDPDTRRRRLTKRLRPTSRSCRSTLAPRLRIQSAPRCTSRSTTTKRGASPAKSSTDERLRVGCCA